ncbi:hypothetical protein PI126_g9844 [Phytophthora idaei]|nr:hypothetical protein PI126_g9844 [Phytophthora idaei]
MMRAAAEDRLKTGSVPIFLTVLPPKIESISHEALVKWTKDRRDYETDLHDRCRVTGEDYNAVLNVDPVDVTEGMLTAEIKHIVESVKNKMLPDTKEYKEFKHELKMNVTESDVNVRFKDYFKVSRPLWLTMTLLNASTSSVGRERSVSG